MTDDSAMTWKPHEEAKIGERLRIRTKAGREFDAILGWFGQDDAGEDCVTWAGFGGEPECWSDGICWLSNADGKESDMPVSFRPLPPPPASEGK